MAKVPYRWYALYCEPRRDLRVAEELRDRGHEIVCPYEVRRKQQACGRHQFRMVETRQSVFSPYVFIRTDDFLGVSGTIGVIDFVRVGADVLPIPDAAVDHLRRLTDSDGKLLRGGEIGSTWFVGKIGSSFDFNRLSPLRGLVGRIVSLDALDERGEIRALVTLLGGEREVVVPISTMGMVYDQPVRPQRQVAA